MGHLGPFGNFYLTVAWIFTPVLVVQRVNVFEEIPYGLFVSLCVLCIGTTLREYPWKKFRPVSIPVLDFDTEDDVEMFQTFSKASHYGLRLQYIAITGLVIDTTVLVISTLNGLSGWSYVLPMIELMLYFLLLTVFTMLMCTISPALTLQPRVHIRYKS